MGEMFQEQGSRRVVYRDNTLELMNRVCVCVCVCVQSEERAAEIQRERETVCESGGRKHDRERQRE